MLVVLYANYLIKNQLLQLKKRKQLCIAVSIVIDYMIKYIERGFVKSEILKRWWILFSLNNRILRDYFKDEYI